jgi:hypothetical protein
MLNCIPESAKDALVIDIVAVVHEYCRKAFVGK